METARIRNPLNSLDMALDKLCDPSSRRVKRKYLLGDNFFAHLLYKLSYMHIVVCNLRSKTRNRNHSREKFLISMLYPNIFNRQISKQAAFGAMEWNSWFWKLKQTCMKCQGNLLIAIEIGTFKLTFGSKILHWCSDIFRYFVLKMSEKEANIRLECQKYTQNLIKLWFSER